MLGGGGEGRTQLHTQTQFLISGKIISNISFFKSLSASRRGWRGRNVHRLKFDKMKRKVFWFFWFLRNQKIIFLF